MWTSTEPSSKYGYDHVTKEFYRKDGQAEPTKESKAQRQCWWCHLKRVVNTNWSSLELDLVETHTIEAWGQDTEPSMVHTRYCFACGRKLVDGDD
jgi:hypothetical protein